MAAKLKVWGVSLGRERSIVATERKADAARLLNMSMYSFNLYACETGNPEELPIALGEPGVPFFAPYSGPEKGVFGKLREHERRGK